MDLKFASYKNDMDNDITLDLKMKSAEVLTVKKDTHIINQNSDLDLWILTQKSYLDNFLTLYLHKRCVIFMKEFLGKSTSFLDSI